MFMLEPDSNKTNKVENSSPGMTEGTEDESFCVSAPYKGLPA